ncbi:MAG: hypothetical protein AAB453_01540 [Patescibacteria group bacterium]
MLKISKVLIIGFLFGAIVPFYLTMIIGSRFLVAPGRYFSTPFMQQVPTRFAQAVDVNGNPFPLSEESKKYIEEHPTSPQTNTLSWAVFFIVNGIFYALIFWLIYRIFRKKPQANIIS